jgi:hypothetical protein
MDPFCVNCGEPFFGGLCVWCTCKECGSDIRDGVCWDCNSPTYDQRFFNNPSNVPDYYLTPPPPSFNCYNCGNPSEEGLSCGQCFCNQCGYTNCICYAQNAETSYACDTNFNNYPQNDFNLPFQNSYEQVPYFNGDSFQYSSNYENCGRTFENSYHEPNFCYDSHGFNQPPQTSDFTNNICEIKSMIEKLKELVANRYTHTPEPHVKSMEELLAEERKGQLCECCMYDDDDSMVTIVFNPQKESISTSVEPEDSLTLGDEHLNTIPATKSDDFNKSSVENLVPIQSESGGNSNGDMELVDNITPVDEEDIFDSSPNPTPSSDPLISDFSIPSLTLDERNDVFLYEIEACLANDSIPTMVDDSNFDPEGDILLLEKLLNEEPSLSLPPKEVEFDHPKDFDDLVPRVSETFNMTFTNPLFDFELDFNLISNNPIFDIPCDESEMEPEVQDSHDMIDSPHEKLSDELTHTISTPDIENDENDLRENVLTEEIRNDDLLPNTNSIFFDLPSSRPPAKPPDVDFELDVNEVLVGVVDETYDHDDPVLDILPIQPTRDSEIDFAFIIWVFYPFFAYSIISSLFHSTGSEDTVFDPGISVYARCPFHLLSPRTN